ncbi:MAG: bifunctional D-altronate/D-mannonate dehydratase [Caldilineaceae bacterium]|nr:bifunctional D-altronate/D-mannonate dehydratase [Caldilineaceae bacterium]MBP8109116.1 bifunctional D-altronate/D-mannonate dehydratase [Caldilineaceae bacterium]MBP8122799.1 bifunctional D-altronate/D-mannonate dehydratase [Caldilineaceae bacterium]MBP9072070.1 bifunctional D-altronate/D-mannonate dehydratase [Caldilineaceae bacterium]
MGKITIEDVKVILTQPGSSQLVVVKVITSEPGLYGLGCATYKQRFRAVHAAIEHHLKPFAIGREVARVEEFWQMAMVNGYWRNGPVMNNAISGIDQALWDIKGKLAGMPVYELLGGKVREAAQVYVHASGETPEEVVESLHARRAEGFRYLRVQMGVHTGGYGGLAPSQGAPAGSPTGAYYDPRQYMRDTLGLLAHVRAEFGEEIELLHDVHERLSPSDAVQFAKDVEQFKLFFLEDVLPPEHAPWFERIRQQTSTPLAMGELFNHPLEWQPLIANRQIDFMRMHMSQMGGITPAKRVAGFADLFGVRTAWHGPSDTSPVGHAANLHLDLWAPNFGIQEWYRPKELDYEIFPGLPEVRDGYLYPNDRPGLGIDIDEKLAARYPCQDEVIDWTQARLPDGTPARP